MSTIEKIKAEIERLKKEQLTRNSIGVITGTGVFVDANELLSFLDTLEGPKIVDGEDETELNSIAYLEQLGYTCIPPDSGRSEKPNNHEEHVPEIKETGTQGLDEAAENYIAPIENDAGLDFINFSGRDIRDAFIAGAEWQRDQMMKEAVEGTVHNFSSNMPHPTVLVDAKGFNQGDKVRIIIVKEDAE